MKAKVVLLTADQVLILKYLKKHPERFLTGSAIARLADSRWRYLEDPHWSYLALIQLTEMKLLKIGGDGRFRLRPGCFSKPPVNKNEVGLSRRL